MSLATAFGNIKELSLRTRTFEFNGHNFKVKVPLTCEMEAIQERLKEPSAELIEKHYEALTKEFEPSQELIDSGAIVVTDKDIVIDGRSLRELAGQKAVAERRIVEMFKLLIPVEQGFDMETITYEMIDELFPFAIQLELMERIASTIAPDYKERKGK